MTHLIEREQRYFRLVARTLDLLRFQAESEQTPAQQDLTGEIRRAVFAVLKHHTHENLTYLRRLLLLGCEMQSWSETHIQRYLDAIDQLMAIEHQ